MLPAAWQERLRPWRRDGVRLFGGALRDLLLGRPCKDVDLLVPSPVRASIPATGATLIPLDAARDIWRLVWPDGVALDLKGYTDLDAEIRKSDFTVNALMADPVTGVWDDRVGGLADLQARVLRAVSPTALADDPLRVLRAVRGSVQCGLSIEPATLAQVRAAVPLLAPVARERIADELRLLADSPAAAVAWERCEEWGILPALFPVLDAARGCRQNDFHHLDVLQHSLAAVRCFTEDLLPYLADDAWTAYWAETDGLWTRRAMVTLALLLHDAGKPAALTVDGAGRRRFHNHEVLGAELLADCLPRLGLPGAVTDTVVLLTRHHMRAGLGVEAAGSERVRRKYADLAGDWAPAGWVAAAADRLATRGVRSTPDRDALLTALHALGEQWFTRRTELLLPRLVTGADVLALGVSGPRVGALLRQVREAQTDGSVSDRAAALRRLRELADG